MAIYPYLLAVSLSGEVAGAAHIHLLIERLGSSKYADRTAAYKALDALGGRALSALRTAQWRTPDKETLNRVHALLSRIEERVYGPLLRELSVKQGPNAVNGVTFSPDEKLLASASEDGTVTLWAVSTGEATGRLKLHSRCYSVAFSSDGTLLASGGDKGKIIIEDVVSRKIRHTLSGNSEFVRSLVVSPNGRFLASGGLYGRVKVWNFATGSEVLHISTGLKNIVGLTFSPDGQTLAVAGSDLP